MRTGLAIRIATCALIGVVLSSTARGQTQLLSNAGFEAGAFGGWETFGPGWRTSSYSNETGSDAHSGTFGAVDDVKEGDKDEWRGISQVLPVKHGMLYSGSVWIRAFKGQDGEAMLEFQFLDKDKNVMEFKQSEAVSGDQAYTQVEIKNAEPPKHAELLAIRGIVHMTKQPGKEGNYFLFDDFELSAVSKGIKSDTDNGRKGHTPADRAKPHHQPLTTTP